MSEQKTLWATFKEQAPPVKVTIITGIVAAIVGVFAIGNYIFAMMANYDDLNKPKSQLTAELEASRFVYPTTAIGVGGENPNVNPLYTMRKTLMITITNDGDTVAESVKVKILGTSSFFVIERAGEQSDVVAAKDIIDGGNVQVGETIRMIVWSDSDLEKTESAVLSFEGGKRIDLRIITDVNFAQYSILRSVLIGVGFFGFFTGVAFVFLLRRSVQSSYEVHKAVQSMRKDTEELKKELEEKVKMRASLESLEVLLRKGEEKLVKIEKVEESLVAREKTVKNREEIINKREMIRDGRLS